ncbi:nitroreductase family protein [Bordetella holmesii H620]|nr:nitroreductase family protein [Bordetella holmesii H620]KCV01021.1 nitroreductase family protein [Bordetella holmesii CDC-H719-BH]
MDGRIRRRVGVDACRVMCESASLFRWAASRLRPYAEKTMTVDTALMRAALQAPAVSTVVADPASVQAAIASRFCCREFLGTPVARATIERILRLASWAPSGSNIQPWKVYVVQGASRDALSRKVCEANDALAADPALASQYREEYQYYPDPWVSPYLERRRACGLGLYGVLNIAKGDRLRMHAQMQCNYEFFGAPVGIFFTNESLMAEGALVDTAMFVQNVMIAARAEGLHTCIQAAWNPFASIVLPHLGAQKERLVCALALGYADEQAPVNTFRPDRVDPAAYTSWLDLAPSARACRTLVSDTYDGHAETSLSFSLIERQRRRDSF